MTFNVRQIRESDIDGFWKALSSVVNERKYLLTLQPPLLQDSEKFIQRNINNNYAQYVAEVQGEIVGWADIIPKQKEALKHVGELGIGVIAGYRGNGIGRELLQRVIEHSWKYRLERLELEVFASNTKAVSLYESFGFQHEGTKRNGRLIDGRYEDVYLMALLRIKDNRSKSLG